MEHTHIANPVRVVARQIISTSGGSNAPFKLHFADGSAFHPTPEMTARYTPESGDYLVRQEDGYEYLNPKDVFERKYSPAPRPVVPMIVNLGFGQALEHLKAGARIARAGWNGKNMWLCLGQGNPDLPADQFWGEHTRAFALESGGSAPVLPYIIMKTAGDEILMGWLASQSDMLAVDWQVL
jgi:hypothetical protein